MALPGDNDDGGYFCDGGGQSTAGDAFEGFR